MADLTVLDFFCGAGGFSEGFRQEGFTILGGFDHWRPAIETFALNFGVGVQQVEILDFSRSIAAIEQLDDVDVLLGSPPCVNFSSSNRSGKADKTLGIELTKAFLKVVAVKKWKPNSRLKAWFMENVPRSLEHLPGAFTFTDLDLTEWAMSVGIDPSGKAITLSGNQFVLNSADYGAPQVRLRAITGEIVKTGEMVEPDKTHSNVPLSQLPPWRTLGSVIDSLPSPNTALRRGSVRDPLYNQLTIDVGSLTDHFYDTGIFEVDWRTSQYLKTNHPYMGRMSFPEDSDRPSRTVTATKIGSSREALVLASERNLNGNGQYRTPTVREAACLMGFPISYQFYGSEGTKWRLVGNAVSPNLSRALARVVLRTMNRPTHNEPIVSSDIDLQGVFNLNSGELRDYTQPPKKKAGCRFRRHPFKDGNITVTLSNYDIRAKEKTVGRWQCSVQYGTGEGFPSHSIPEQTFLDLERVIEETPEGPAFLKAINNGFLARVATGPEMQRLFEEQVSEGKYANPVRIIDDLRDLINELQVSGLLVQNGSIQPFPSKNSVPVKQLYALYAICRITSLANRKPS